MRLEFTPDPAQEAFGVVKARVYARLAAEGGPKAPRWLKIEAFLLLTVALGAYAGLLGLRPAGLGALTLGATCGVATLIFALNVSHDAAHGSFARDPRVDGALLFVAFAFLGVDPTMWRARHLRSHHRFPNVDSCDADIDENPFLRLSPHQPRRAWHKAQHLYAWGLYALVAWHAAWVQDFVYMRRTRLANMTDWPARTPGWPRFVFTKVIHLGLVYVLPLAVLPDPAWVILAGLGVIQSAISLLFILPLIGTHFSSAAEFPSLDDGRLPHGFVTHQIVTSVDWHPRSRLASALLGGLNAHAAHHLFPRVSHAHYPWISAEIGRFCGEVGLKHNVVGLGGAIRNHYGFLRHLARAPGVDRA